MRLIDADKVNKTIDRFIGYLDEDMILRIKMKISAIPTVEKPHGEWVHTEDGECYCTICKVRDWTNSDDYLFCPWCGADMRKERDGMNISQVVVDEWMGE